MSGWFGTKKRKATEEDNVLHSEKNDVSEELIAMKSTINELLNQIRTQTDNMTSMMQLMNSMQGEMKNMRMDMKVLSNKCDGLQNSIQSIHRNSLIDNNMITSRFDDVEEQIEDLDTRFGHAHDKLNYHYILLKNQKWEYSATNPPSHYWDTILDVEQAEAESFLKVIKKNTELIRYGQIGDGKIDFNEVESDNYYIPYDEAFLPHWQEFLTAIHQYQNYLKVITNDDESESILDLCNVELPGGLIDLLSAALETAYFNTLKLSWNNFGQEGIEFVLNYLQSNNKCKHLCLNYNVIKSWAIDSLSRIVETHPVIGKLELRGCKGENVVGYDMLKQIMRAGRNKLKSLDLSENSISTGGDTFISDFLAGNPVLKTLHLHSNDLDDNDAVLIASALKHNTNLTILDLKFHRNITSTGWEALGKAIFDKTSLNSAADSNHKCRIISHSLGFRDNVNGPLAPAVSYDPIYVRQKKIYSVLSARNRNCSNVDHFDDDMPVELLPHMMHSIQDYSDYYFVDNAPPEDTQDVKPLSIAYEILKQWDKTLAVFEAIGS